MKLTRTQKIYATVMALAAGALVWDRAGGAPATAEASAGKALLLQTSAKAVAETRSSREDSNTSFAASAAGHRFRQRLAILARDEQLDPNLSTNAFALSTKWVTKPVDPTSSVVGPPLPGLNEKRLDAFRQHHLAAVMVGHRGYANVDGQGVFVGETFDEFRLLSVTKSAARFGFEGLEVELHLLADAKLNHKGSVIENAVPRNGTIPLK